MHKKAVFMFLAGKRGPWATLLTQAAILKLEQSNSYFEYLFIIKMFTVLNKPVTR